MAVANDFLAAAAALDLSPEAKDTAFARVRALGLSPDDPATMHIVIGAALEAQAGNLLHRIDAAPAILEQAAKRAVGPVAEAATAKARADLAKIGATVADRAAASIQNAADEAFATVERSARLRVNAQLIVAFGVVAALAFGIGVWLGDRWAADSANEWASLGARADSPAWRALILNNPDINASLNSACASGMPSAFVQGGSRACRLPVWLDPPSPPAAPGTAQAAYSSALAWLNSWSPTTLIAIGLFVGLLLRRLAKLAAMPKVVRWLLDL